MPCMLQGILVVMKRILVMKRLSRIIGRIVSTSIISLALCACSIFSSEKESPRDEYAGWNAEKFYTEAKRALTDKNYDKAVKLYEKLESRYPFGRYATQGQMEIAYAYYKSSEPESAIAAVDRFIKLNPRHPNVDYAYYLKGLVNYNRGITFLERFLPTDSSQRDPGSSKDAYEDFNQLINKFPNSRYVEDAKQRMIALRNNLAVYEIHVARYYMKREAYLAAVKRCQHVLEKYERTPAVPVALQIMESAYRKLDLPELADDAARVYALNYPNGAPEMAQLIMPPPSPVERFWRSMGFEE